MENNLLQLDFTRGILKELTGVNCCTYFVFISPQGQPPLALKHQLREKGMLLLLCFSDLGGLFYELKLS